MSEEPTWLTQEAFDRLAAELNELLTVARADIARRIGEAREEGDLKENGGYHAAKEEQGKIEARILLGSAEIAEDHINVYSPDSPVGKAILGLKIGETATYLTPMGKERTVKVLNVEPFRG